MVFVAGPLGWWLVKTVEAGRYPTGEVRPFSRRSRAERRDQDSLSAHMAAHGMRPPAPVQPPPAATTPRQREAPFVPESVEPTIEGGSPRPRRRRRDFALGSEFIYKDMQPSVLPSGALTDEAMAAAFGHSAMFCAAHAAAPSETDQMVLERLKSLNVTDLLRHFRGEGELPSPPILPSADTPQFPVAGFKGAVHWPAL